MNYQHDAVSYCVNYKGQKIKPYKSLAIKKLTKIERIILAIKKYF